MCVTAPFSLKKRAPAHPHRHLPVAVEGKGAAGGGSICALKRLDDFCRHGADADAPWSAGAGIICEKGVQYDTEYWQSRIRAKLRLFLPATPCHAQSITRRSKTLLEKREQAVYSCCSSLAK